MDTFPRPGERDPRAGPSGSNPALILGLLSSVARADATFTASERAMLEHYRRVLEAPGTTFDTVDSTAAPFGAARPGASQDGVGLDLRQIPEPERVHVLRMLMRVAFADGTCNPAELDLLRRLATMMGLSTVQFVDVRESVERHVLDRRRSRRWLFGLAGVVVLFIATFAIANRYQDAATRRMLTDVHSDLTRLRGQIDEMVASDRTVAESGSIADIEAQLDRFEAEILEQVARSQSDERTPDRNEVEPLKLVLASLEQKVARIQERQVPFKRFERQYASSVLLIKVGYRLVSSNDSLRFAGDGTGFFVTKDGLIATSKHVVQPWKFHADAIRLLSGDYRLDEDSVRVVAWPAGTRFKDAAGNASFDGAFDSRQGDLRLIATPPDEYETRTEPLHDGRLFTGSFHVQGDSDLALLEARVGSRVTPLPLLADGQSVEKLDRVMVLGFPGGTEFIEKGIVETSPSLGEIRKIENSLFVTAAIVPGNSGGPVIDGTGRVLGVAARTLSGEATLGVCVQSRHLRALLGTPRSE